MSIKWKEGLVCFALGVPWYSRGNGQLLFDEFDTKAANADILIGKPDFQLNTIKQGDYIEASELNTEHKYNDAVEVLELFGFKPSRRHRGFNKANPNDLTVFNDGYCYSLHETPRKLTYQQLMEIGKLKRLEIEREKSSNSENPNSCEDVVNKPLHYQFFDGVEVIEIIASSMTSEQFKGYCLGNRIKYRLRAGNKDKLEQEIAKSDKYVELYDEHKHLCKS